MLLSETITLTIEGKTDATFLQKLLKSDVVQENQRWVFVDYSPADIPVNTQFDTLLEGEDKSLLPGISIVKLIGCLDQFGNQLPAIPEGFKTICKLEFYPEVPAIIDTLPLLESWAYNPHKITLANHKDILLGNSSDVGDLSSIAFYLIRELFKENESGSINKEEFYSFLSDRFSLDQNRADNILSIFVQTGKIKPLNNNRIELLPAV